MKIIVNSTPLIPPLSGIGRYTQGLLNCLLASNQMEDIRAFNPLKCYSQNELIQLFQEMENDEFLRRSKTALDNFGKAKKVIKAVPGTRLLKTWMQHRLFNKNFSKSKEYIYWETNYILEDFDGISVSTVHDLSHIRYPQFQPSSRRRWLNNNLPDTLAKATAIVAVSEFSKKEIIDIFGVEKEKIFIVSPAVADEFRQDPGLQEKLRFQKKYQLPKHFLLTVGTIEPRKNLSALLEAYKRLPETFKKTYPLVIAGSTGWLNQSVEKLMEPLLAKGQIIRLGYVPQYYLPLLYSAATAFFYISLYEGFGMPVAEAMCSGTPVLTSNISSMPEVAAGCTRLVDPSDVDQIAEEVQELIENKAMREELIMQAKEKSAAYTWGNSADKLIHLFSKLT